MQALVSLLRTQASEEKKRARKESNKNCLRLANLKFTRHGHDYREVWENGFAFQELTSRQEAIVEKKDELEKIRKGLVKRKQPAGLTSCLSCVAIAANSSFVENCR